MTDQLSCDTEPKDAGIESQADSHVLVSILAIAVCGAVFLLITVSADYGSWESLARYGYLPAASIWAGGYWALVTSNFVHFELWHVAFNIYWLWVLGHRLEQAIGSLPFLAFWVVSACVSSSFQLIVSDDTGIGASGVVYAMFGFMWLTRQHYPRFGEVVDDRTAQLFILWLVGCMAVTYFDIWQIGNAAHLSGLLFGIAVAGVFVLDFHRRLMAVGLLSLITAAVIPLFWSPWSVTWLAHRAHTVHVASQFEEAISLYSRIISRDPENTWAYINRSYAYESLGQTEESQADQRKADELTVGHQERD